MEVSQNNNPLNQKVKKKNQKRRKNTNMDQIRTKLSRWSFKKLKMFFI